MKKLSEKFPIVFELLLFVIATLISSVLAIPFQMLGAYPDVSSSIGRILTAILLFLVFFRCFKLKNSLKGFVIMLPALLLALFKIPYHFISGGGSPEPLTQAIILIGLAPAVYEEILFRGIFIFNLKKKYKNPISILLISAIFFGLMHITNLVGMDPVSVLIQVFMAIATGAVLGGVYLLSDDLLSVIIAHAAIDILAGIYPGGMTATYYVLAIFILLLAGETAYGFFLAKKASK